MPHGLTSYPNYKADLSQCSLPACIHFLIAALTLLPCTQWLKTTQIYHFWALGSRSSWSGSGYNPGIGRANSFWRLQERILCSLTLPGSRGSWLFHLTSASVLSSLPPSCMDICSGSPSRPWTVKDNLFILKSLNKLCWHVSLPYKITFSDVPGMWTFLLGGGYYSECLIALFGNRLVKLPNIIDVPQHGISPFCSFAAFFFCSSIMIIIKISINTEVHNMKKALLILPNLSPSSDQY